MAWRSYSAPIVPFCSPLAPRPVCSPSLYRTYPDWRQSFYHGGRHGGIWSGDKSIAALQDKKLEQLGDLGWSLDYATAWCYRHLVGRRPEVSNAIDTIRFLCDEITPETPFEVFDHLDTTLFGSKLRTMVYLRWKPHASCTTGTTSGPNIAGAPRITIDLNSTAFDGFDSDIDDLLEALIHQMIHAFFLVCCGVQKLGDKQDGRLMDGVHFGVILLTIKDICKSCTDGPLRLVFHASKRNALEGHIPSMDSVWPYAWDTMRGGDSATTTLQPYILTSGVGPAPADNQTHCLHDNRHVTFREIQNWQVQVWARALDANMESKGATIWDFNEKQKLVEHDRRFITKPSVTYIELIWDKKRVMAPREKALAFKSQKATIEKDAKFELAIPECEEHIFKCIYDFFNRKAYGREEGEEELARRRSLGRRQLAPVIVGYLRGAHVRSGVDKAGIIMHIEVFKMAEKLSFKELNKYALLRLYELESTDDNPIEALRMIYLESPGDNEGPIHSDLHNWARRFLSRTDEHRLETYPLGSTWCKNGIGVSNLVKILQLHEGGFQELYGRSRSFREDVQIALSRVLSGQGIESLWSSPLGSMSTDSLLTSPLLGGRLGGLGGRPLLTTSLSDRITDRVTETIDDRLIEDIGILPGMGMGLEGMGRANGLLGLPPLRRASADILGGDLSSPFQQNIAHQLTSKQLLGLCGIGGPRIAPVFDHLPAL